MVTAKKIAHNEPVRSPASKSLFFQPKLNINQPNDVYEQEADHIADKVMRMTETPVNHDVFFKPAISQVQRKCHQCEEEEEKKLHRKENSEAEIQDSTGLDKYVGSLSSSGQPLPENSRNFFEPRFGRDFSSVRIHNDNVAAKSAQSINALAYTTGNSIVFNIGQYAPESNSGKKLLAHELTHVVQQGNAKSDNQVQKTSIVTKGTVAHSGAVGMAPGSLGPAVGNVEVRTGEEIEMGPGSRIPNVIAIGYTGTFSANSKWLQFIWAEMNTFTPNGRVPATWNMLVTGIPGGSLPLTTTPGSPTWAVDSGTTTDPFYETSSINIRSSSGTTMFDSPGGSTPASLAGLILSRVQGAAFLILTMHFDTYLIQNDTAAYHVPYSASTVYIPTATGWPIVGPIGYSVGAAGGVTALPGNLRTVLLTRYPTFTQIK